ncbi:hypothetical protein DPM19_17840 [Actinomadura craniellae]|uniref:Uncharacterized protein n=1 Tax=Actinomadura craniellae TaxID=2231787 RepID=A0A365H786_9ACTN|nr:hypothetical protein [Actinomadura craniellae]RAY14133.1 hypothetical protein DPM19_17840 [Actinomadura craniellae]
MRPTRRPGRRLCTRGAPPALALALLLTGCGSGGDGGGVASAGGAARKSGAPASMDPREKALKFAQCMRDNGVPMDDPEPGKGIRIRVGGETDRATVEKAMAACRQYSPQADGSPGSDPRMEEAARKFAQCMRDNGVPMDDPKPGQRGIRVDRKLSEDPDFEAAHKKCQAALPGPGARP